MSNIDWHAGFVSAMKLELMANEKSLEFYEEQFLDSRKQRFDLLIIKKRRDIRIVNEIGAIFNKFNIIEYKNPNDILDIGEYYKVLSYTCRYLYERHDYDEYASDAYTMTLVRDTMPHKLFKQLPGAGMETEEKYPGIYELTGRSPFNAQIIITSRLTDEGHAWLKGLTLNGTKEHVQGIIDQIPGLDSKHKSLADTVMNVFTGANTPLMYRIKREDKDMCQAVNELFADEIAELKIELTRQIKINADSKAEAEKAKAEMLAKAKAEVEAEAAKANVYRQQLIEAGITPKD